MDHGDHSGHTMPMPTPGSTAPKCSMNMLWNSQVPDTCVVFRSWHISGWATMIISCLVVILISLGYSLLLHQIKELDRRLAYGLYQESRGSTSNASGRRESVMPRRESLIPPIPAGYSTIENPGAVKMGITKLPLSARTIRATLYALSVAISFWLMLVAMTYNTYLFASIIIGAFLGHLLYEGEMDVGSVLTATGGKGLACH